MRLTKNQKELIEISKKRGYLIMEDFNKIFTSQISIRDNIERLKALKLIKKTNGKFKYIGG